MSQSPAIDSGNPLLQTLFSSTSRVGAEGAAAKSAVASPAVGANAGRTQLSSAALALSAPADNGIRADKVDAIRAAIQNGSYRIDAAGTADKIISSLLG